MSGITFVLLSQICVKLVIMQWWPIVACNFKVWCILIRKVTQFSFLAAVKMCQPLLKLGGPGHSVNFSHCVMCIANGQVFVPFHFPVYIVFYIEFHVDVL